MKTPEFSLLQESFMDLVSVALPIFIMFTYLIPFYYMVSKLAEEKESKAKEGMKMMGLTDLTYFFSWLIFYLAVISIMSLVSSVLLKYNVFPASNLFLVLTYFILYGLSLFGFAVIVVALVGKRRSASTFATLLHLVTFFLSFTVKKATVPAWAKLTLSLFPNVAMFLGANVIFF